MSDENLKILFGDEISADDIFAKLKKNNEEWVRQCVHEKTNRKRWFLRLQRNAVNTNVQEGHIDYNLYINRRLYLDLKQ